MTVLNTMKLCLENKPLRAWLLCKLAGREESFVWDDRAKQSQDFILAYETPESLHCPEKGSFH